MSEFVIKVPDVPEDGKRYEFPIRLGWLERVLAGTDLRRRPAGPMDSSPST